MNLSTEKNKSLAHASNADAACVSKQPGNSIYFSCFVRVMVLLDKPNSSQGRELDFESI
jgi:hypothetical protein